jgi:REP element-mobilizing transposase RayT
MANDKHRRRSIRLQGYDYSQAGAYFVTVSTHDKECLFGEIADGEIKLNAFGEVAQASWYELPQHFSYLGLDVFVIMPNHVHGIIVLNGVGAQHAAPPRGGLRPNVQAGSLGAVVRSFKSAVSKQINELQGTPGMPVWQRNYYEHVIRNAEELHRIRQYIVNNPLQWALDRENPAVAGVGAQHAAPLRDDIDDLLGGIWP